MFQMIKFFHIYKLKLNSHKPAASKLWLTGGTRFKYSKFKLGDIKNNIFHLMLKSLKNLNKSSWTLCPQSNKYLNYLTLLTLLTWMEYFSKGFCVVTMLFKILWQCSVVACCSPPVVMDIPKFCSVRAATC